MTSVKIQVVSQLPSEPAKVLSAIEGLAVASQWKSFHVSVAYATMSGVVQLVSSLRRNLSNYDDIAKSFLVGLDFGLTEPEAIEFLGSEVKSICRVCVSNNVLSVASLAPKAKFHPKLYAFSRGSFSKNDGAAAIIGSANLTRSAFLSNWETVCCVSDVNCEAAGNEFRQGLEQAVLASKAHPEATSELTAKYRLLRKGKAPPRELMEPSYESRAALKQDLRELLAGSRFFWTDTLKIVSNRGPGNAGNQVDLKKGARWFFDLYRDMDLPQNSSLGSVKIRWGNCAEVECEMRFGNNSMDKLNLPIPGVDGPDDYSHCCIGFQRVGKRQFRLLVAPNSGKWSALSQAEGTLFDYAGGQRQWGVCALAPVK